MWLRPAFLRLHQPFVYPSAYLPTPSLILPPHPPLSPAAAAFYDYGPPFGPGAAAAAASVNQAAAAAAAAAELGYPFSTSPSTAALAAAAAASYLAPQPPPHTTAHHAGPAAAAAAAAYYTLQQPLGAMTSGTAGSLSHHAVCHHASSRRPATVMQVVGPVHLVPPAAATAHEHDRHFQVV
ncbi:hypothetical protein HPB51_014271 [Rhipicephalus microplus]|uniref:Uncharacterized protein n=1 Tax=Rhipicephalus microplus TaxID=6941 RepID=A0A9J6DVQ1_RHIMP|nr:hypothetical protein HPB51_014271 [Rhipicephalus microplus]